MKFKNQVCNERFNLVRTFLIEDACGNETTAQQIISVWDDIAPELATPLDSVFFHCSYDAPDCDEMATELSFVDNCDSQVSLTNCEDILIEEIVKVNNAFGRDTIILKTLAVTQIIILIL